MSKKLTIYLLCFTMLFSIIGCGEKETGKNSVLVSSEFESIDSLLDNASSQEDAQNNDSSDSDNISTESDSSDTTDIAAIEADTVDAADTTDASAVTTDDTSAETTADTSVKTTEASVPSVGVASIYNSSSQSFSVLSYDAPEIVSNSAIIMDIDSGTIIYEKNAYDAHYPASVVKIMTAMLAIESGKLDSDLTMSDNAVYGIESGSSHISLQVDEQISLRDAVYAMILKSANEASLGIAEKVSGNSASFVELMNSKGNELGFKNTNFANPNGLHNDDQYTCAYDMALLGRYAYQNEEFRAIIGASTYTIPATNKSDARVLNNGNRMTDPESDYYYQYCTGNKTGYTEKSNGTMISFAEKNGLRLVCIVLDCDPSISTFSDVSTLFDYTFDHFTRVTPLSNEKISTENNLILNNYALNIDRDFPEFEYDDTMTVLFRSDVAVSSIYKEIIYTDSLSKNCGTVYLSYNGVKLGESPIISPNYVPASIKAATNVYKAKQKQKSVRTIVILLIILAAIIAFLVIYGLKILNRRNRKSSSKRRSTSPDSPNDDSGNDTPKKGLNISFAAIGSGIVSFLGKAKVFFVNLGITIKNGVSGFIYNIKNNSNDRTNRGNSDRYDSVRNNQGRNDSRRNSSKKTSSRQDNIFTEFIEYVSDLIHPDRKKKKKKKKKKHPSSNSSNSSNRQSSNRPRSDYQNGADRRPRADYQNGADRRPRADYQNGADRRPRADYQNSPERRPRNRQDY